MNNDDKDFLNLNNSLNLDNNLDVDDADDESEESNIITLTDEKGVDTEYEFLDLISYEGKDYVVLLPVESDDEDDGMVVILEVEESDDPDTESYVSVEDEELLSSIFDIFKDKWKDEFDFTE